MKNLTLSKTNTLVNIGNSILKFFGVTPFNDTHEKLDEILNKTNKKKICLVLFDAFGKNILDIYKDNIKELYSHLRFEIDSVYPTTTVAATTALITAKYPIQTGYFGWSEYFEEYKDLIMVFPSMSKIGEHKKYPDIQNGLLKVDKIWDVINEKNNKEIATGIFCFNSETFDEYFIKTDEALNKYDFVYSYSDQPDHSLHDYGIESTEALTWILYLKNKLLDLINKHQDTLFILLADHGMVNNSTTTINDYPEFMSSINGNNLQLEPRFAGFNVKNYAKFKEFYDLHLSEKFILKTKEELLNEHTFGYGTPHELADSILPDYYIIAHSDNMLNDLDGPKHMLANHAGITKEEKTIGVMIFND